jgi:type I restriction enzyme, R subunit
MALSELDTRAKLIDPAIHARGWTEDLIRREETAGIIEVIDGRPRRRAKGRVDYVLRVKVNSEAQPVAVALIEAKAEHLPPTHGLEQAKLYAACKRLNVPFVYSSNGRLFVEYDRLTGQTSTPRPLDQMPTPADLRTRYEQHLGFSLDAPAARPLLTRYKGGEGTRRYYQDAAIRAVLEKLAQGEKRALLPLATGSGKTFIAVNLLRRLPAALHSARSEYLPQSALRLAPATSEVPSHEASISLPASAWVLHHAPADPLGYPSRADADASVPGGNAGSIRSCPTPPARSARGRQVLEVQDARDRQSGPR